MGTTRVAGESYAGRERGAVSITGSKLEGCIVSLNGPPYAGARSGAWGVCPETLSHATSLRPRVRRPPSVLCSRETQHKPGVGTQRSSLASHLNILDPAAFLFS